MKIYAVADIHAKPHRLDLISANVARLCPDLLIVAGDLTNYLAARSVVRHLASLPVPVFAVRGNTDRRLVGRHIAGRDGIFSGYMPPTERRPFAVLGLDGTVPVPFRSRIALKETKRLKLAAPLVDERTLLVVHTPPWGVLDEVMGRFHAGSKNLGRFIRNKAPFLVVCGHIHERQGYRRLGSSHVVNCTMGRGGQGAVVHLVAGDLSRPRIEFL